MISTLRKLRVAHSKAEMEERDTFTLNGSEFVTDYAKYLIQYFEGKRINPDVAIEFKSQDKVEKE